MLEAFKASRDQTLQAERDALNPEPASVRERLQRSLSRPGSKSEAEKALAAQVEASRSASSATGTLPVAPGGPASGPGSASSAASPSGAMPSKPQPLVDTSQPSEEPQGVMLSPWFLIGYSLTLGVLAFVLGWQLGDRNGSHGDAGLAEAGIVNAGPKTLPNPAVLPNQVGFEDSTEAEATSESAPSVADLAFENPANRHTLVAESFNHHRQGRERAIAHYHYLKDQGFPVIKPRLKDNVIYLLVGAAPDEASLRALLRELKALQYPGSQGRTFSGAYGSPIHHVF